MTYSRMLLCVSDPREKFLRGIYFLRSDTETMLIAQQDHIIIVFYLLYIFETKTLTSILQTKKNWTKYLWKCFQIQLGTFTWFRGWTNEVVEVKAQAHCDLISVPFLWKWSITHGGLEGISLKFGTNIHLESRMNWLEIGVQRSKWLCVVVDCFFFVLHAIFEKY